jgi:hypothetical protein
MDPTVARGNIFTTKGVQNHLVSDMWKASVRKEYCTERRWQASYNKTGLERERDLVDSARHHENTVRFSPSRALLPLTLRGTMGQSEDEEARQRGVGMSRRDLLAFHRSTLQQGAMTTASSDIGSRSSDRQNAVLVADRRTLGPQTSHGHKPVIASSFFRRSGAF